MADLAIRGHETRGKEVIEILRRFGGENVFLSGFDIKCVYFIKNTRIFCLLEDEIDMSNFRIFALEEFLEKFPYKIGDRVRLSKDPCTITGMMWNSDSNEVYYYAKGNDFTKRVFAKDLQPYKEEIN